MSPICLGTRAVSHRAVIGFLAVVLAVSLSVNVASACPFCGTVTQTLGEEMNGAAAVVLARIVPSEGDAGQTEAAAPDGEVTAIPAVQPKTTFRIEKIIKGEEKLGDAAEVEILFFGQPKPEAVYLVMGIDGPSLEWSTPIVLTDEAVAYVSQLLELPEKGGERLAFFQEYFEHADPMLAQDSYDEFAKAPYAEVGELKEQMDHDKLVGWIKNADVISSRRRLYLTLLGICGSEADVPMLQEMIRSDNRETKTALDALIACYLTLAGNDGLPLVEEMFLANADAEYTDTYAAIMALRFHGQEGDIIDRERLLAAMRLMLDRPTLADLVIPDLARWEDWSVAGRLVTLYKEADTDSSWVRVPVIHYLRALDTKIESYLKELAEVDPDAYKRANTFFPIQKAAKPAPPAADATDTATTETATTDAATTDAATTDTATTDATSTDTPVADTTTADATSDETADETADASADESTDTSDATVAEPTAAASAPPQDEPSGDFAAAASDPAAAASDANEPVESDSAVSESAAAPVDEAVTEEAQSAEAASEPAVEAAATAEGSAEGHDAHSSGEGITAVSWASTIVVLPVIGVLLFALFAVLLLGGRHSSQQG